MVSKSIKLLAFMGMAALLASCAATQPSLRPFTASDLNSKVRSGDYVQKVDSFEVILDASGSMAEGYKGDTKFNIARDFVHRMNQTIPDLKLTAGLRKFGGTVNPFAKQTELVYGMTDYSKGGFEEGLKMVLAAKGETPMAESIGMAAEDLKSAPGKMALIIVGDGRATDMQPAKNAQDLKRQFGDRLCIYTVALGNDPEGLKTMQKIADAGGCGFSTNADSLGSSGEIADFVEKVFLARVEKSAAAPPPPPPAPMKQILDSDRDGVPDDRDKCPGTPLGAPVDADGCWNLDHVYFDFDKAVVKPQYHAMLDEVIAIMNGNPDLKLNLNGYTCSLGDVVYNQGLSKKRSEAVAAYFQNKGISGDRLITSGNGIAKPPESNATRKGRMMNRRVELQPVF